jgi:hypothetical protein
MLNWLKNLIALRNDIPAREPAVMAPPPKPEAVPVAVEPKKKAVKKPAAKKAAAPRKARKPKQ